MNAELLKLLKSPLCFEKPLRRTDISSWHGHLPFAFASVGIVKPKVLVELGTHKGDSYCAFCQAAAALSLECSFYAVDTWEGDEHAGIYGPEVLEELADYHDPLYGHFSTLLKMPFDEALSRFEDGVIDLLHIDGLHTYEAVKHDFESWLPKMRPEGVILLHDTKVFQREFGVWRFWDEIREVYPNLEFFHSHGLGVVGVGSVRSEGAGPLFNLSDLEIIRIRRFFSEMGDLAARNELVTPEQRNQMLDRLETAVGLFNPDAPAISVIIPSYNHEKFIREAIYSVLGQSVTDFELIVIDDGSQDNSDAVIRSIHDPRIRYCPQENQGAHNAINRGIMMAKGTYISVLNSDDVYHPKRFQTILGRFDEDEPPGAVFSHIECIDEWGNFLEYKRGAESNWRSHQPETSFKEEHQIVLDLLAGNFLLSTSNLFCKRGVFEEIGLFKNLRYTHDYDFFLKLCNHTTVQVLDRPLLKYRVHSQNTFAEKNMAAANFEAGLVLFNFLQNFDIKPLIPENDEYRAMLKLFNSLDTRNTDRMFAVLSLFQMKGQLPDSFFETLTQSSENIFRKGCVQHFEKGQNDWKEYVAVCNQVNELNHRIWETETKLGEMGEEANRWWLNSQDAWKRVDEVNQQLSEMAKEANQWWLNSQEAWRSFSEANRLAGEKQQQLDEANTAVESWRDKYHALSNSRSYKLGSFLTWPLRIFRRDQ